MKVFFVVLAREASALDRKIRELNRLGYPYVVVCGEKVNHPRVVYRKPRGKYDTVNYGLNFVPSDTDIIAVNDMDTEIHNAEAALCRFARYNSGSSYEVKT